MNEHEKWRMTSLTLAAPKHAKHQKEHMDGVLKAIRAKAFFVVTQKSTHKNMFYFITQKSVFDALG